MNKRQLEHALVTRDVRRRFDRAATTIERADFVHRTTRDGLLARIAPLTITAERVVDLGAGTGAASRDLKQRFARADIISVDLSLAMLRHNRRGRWWQRPARAVQATAEALPFANESVDVVFCNMMLPWVTNPDRVFAEVARILRKEGVFAFATLGPDSLQQLARAWRDVDAGPHVMAFSDMHDLGDGLVRAGLADPVLDVDRLTIEYRDPQQLFRDLTDAGARNALAGRRQTLTGRGRFAAMVSAMLDAASEGTIPVDLELVFGHCFGAGRKQAASDFRIDARHIPLRRELS